MVKLLTNYKTYVCFSISGRIRSKTLLKAMVDPEGRAGCAKAYSSYDWQQKLPRGIIAEQICAIDREGHNDTCEVSNIVLQNQLPLFR